MRVFNMLCMYAIIWLDLGIRMHVFVNVNVMTVCCAHADLGANLDIGGHIIDYHTCSKGMIPPWE